jgi:hypothetical protein
MIFGVCGQFWDVPSEEYKYIESVVFRNVSVVVLTLTLLKPSAFEYVKEVGGGGWVSRSVLGKDELAQSAPMDICMGMPVRGQEQENLEFILG